MKRVLSMAALAALLSLPTACDSLDDMRIPTAPVYLAFNTVHEWNVYGTPAAMDHKRFILETHTPSNYPWVVHSATGFGGILLLSDIMGEPRAYDLSCPVEAQRSVRVAIDEESMLAECPKCHSTYDVFSLSGHPVAGPAADKGYGLTRYRVSMNQGSVYLLVTQ